jgi:predicted dehydrogenase
MRPARLVLIGAGSMGRNHARVIAESPNAKLAMVIDPSEETGRETAERYGAKWAPRLDAVAGMDAAVIAASTEHHYNLATDVIAERIPLLIEKPVCASFGQTVEILGAAERTDVPIMCGFLERYNPAVMVARRMIGEPLFVRAERHSAYVPRIKTGVAWDLLVHDVDLIVQLFGNSEPDSINVEMARFHPSSLPQAEDVVEASFRFPGGGLGSASASRIGQRKVRSMVVQSLDQMIEIDLLRRGVTVYRHLTISGDEAGDGAGFRQSTEMEVPEIVGREPLATQFERFLGLVAGDIDADEERASILPAHRIVDRALAGRAALVG